MGAWGQLLGMKIDGSSSYTEQIPRLCLEPLLSGLSRRLLFAINLCRGFAWYSVVVDECVGTTGTECVH